VRTRRESRDEWLPLASLFAALYLCSCENYQLEPYAEVQTRDEYFEPAGGASRYGGETYLVGVRYVPPTRISYIDPSAAQTWHASTHHEGSTTTVNIPKADAPETELDKLSKLGKDKDGNWTGWGAAVVIAVVLFARELLAYRRRRSPEVTASNDS